MDELRNKIVYDTSEAVTNIEALVAALNKYNASAKKVAKTSAGATVTEAQKRVDSLFSTTNNATKAAKRVDQLGDSLETTGKKGKKAGGELILSWKSVIRIFSIQVIHQAISKVTSALADGSKEAREYAKSLAEIQTIGPRFRRDFEGLDEQVKAFSKVTGFGLDETTVGLYQTLSNQVATTGREFEFLDAASQLAVGGVTRLDGAVNLLSSSINSYKKSSAEAYDISGKMFKAIELGRFRIDDIANSYGRVLGLSSQLGINQSEVNASMATLTASGMDANEAMTLITNTELKLAKPTKKMRGIFDAIGVSSAEAGVQAFGFHGFLKKIEEQGGGTATELGEIYGRVRAVRGALGLGSSAAERYEKNLKAISSATAETIKKAKDLVYATDAKQLEMEFNRISIALTGFGQSFNSTLLNIIKGAGGGTEAIAALSTSIIAGSATFAVYKLAASGAFSAVTAGAISARASMLSLISTPLGAAVAVGTLAAGIVIAYNHIADSAEAAAERQLKAFKQANKEALIDTVNTVKKEEKVRDNLFSELQKRLTERVKKEKEAAEKTKIDQGAIFGNIKQYMSDRISAVQDYFETIQDEAKEASKIVLELNRNIFGAQFDKEQFKFDRLQKRFNDSSREVFARSQRSADFRHKSLNEQLKGNKQLADFYQQRSISEAKTALSLADQTKNRGLIARAEKEVESTFDNQIKLLEERKKTQIKSAQVARLREHSDAEALRRLESIQKAVQENLKITPDLSDAEIKRMKKAAERYAKLFSDELKGIKSTGILLEVDIDTKINLREQLTEATRDAFNPVIGQVDALEDTMISAFERIGQAYKKIIPSDKRTEAALKALGITGTATEKQKKLLDYKKESDRVDTAFLNTAEERNTLAEKNKKIQQDISSIVETYSKRVSNIAMAIPQDVINQGGLWLASDEIEATSKWLNNYTETIKRVQRAQAEGNTTSKQYVRDIAEIQRIEEITPGKFLGIFGPNIKEKMGSIINNLNETKDLQKAIAEKAPELETRERLQEKIKAADVILKADDSELNKTINDVQTKLDSLPDEKTIKINAEYIQGPTKGEYFGGLYRATGGMARGHDKHLAMLSDGEFVLNAGATRRIFSELTEANASYRYLGGSTSSNSVTNNNNTFNINGAASPQQTAREIQKIIKRENRIRK